MPKYTKQTERIKAQQTAKTFIECGMNASEVARRRGTAPQTENMKLRRKPVRDALQRYLDSPKLLKKLRARLDEGLDSTKVISAMVIAPDGEGMADANSMTKDFVNVEDYATRHKYIVTLLELKGLIKTNGKGNDQEGNTYITTIIGSIVGGAPGTPEFDSRRTGESLAALEAVILSRQSVPSH